MKIAMCGLLKSKNLGEMFIARSLEYLIEREVHAVDPSIPVSFQRVDIFGRSMDDSAPSAPTKKRNRLLAKKDRVFDKIFLDLRQRARTTSSRTTRNAINWVRHQMWLYGRNYRRSHWKNFEQQFAGVDYIVIDGAGLLEYSYNEYHWSLLLISQYAEKHGKHVVYNAIGRAGAFSEHDYFYRILARAMRSPAVSYVSARDNVGEVQMCAGPGHQVKLLADAAFWMREAYGVTKRTPGSKVGIGLIRGNSLSGYGKNFGSKDWINLFADIATELGKRGYDFEFFTNGVPGDVKVGQQVIAQLGLDPSYLVARPTDDQLLVEQINSYRAIVTCRMHSSIAAFTLGVPSVILSWNDKVEKLMDLIGYPERAIRRENFDAVTIVDEMEKALKDGIDPTKLDSMKAKATESVTDYVPLLLAAAGSKGK